MSQFPDYICSTRNPAPTPDSIAHEGKIRYGTYDAPFKNLNMLEIAKPCGAKMPDCLKGGRLTEWEAFEVAMDEGALISAVYKVGPIGFSIFVWYDKQDNKVYTWMNFVPKRKAHVASQLVSDKCYCKTKNSEFTIENDFLNGKASAKGFTKSKIGEFSVDMHFERISPPSNCVMPLALNDDGSFRHPLYSEKDFFKANGTITLNGRAYFTNSRSVGIIDDHKGFYPFHSHYDWLTTMGQIDDEGEKKYFAFNLTRNQSIDQHQFNENIIWIEDKSYPMPPVVFTHETRSDKKNVWHVKDETGMDLVNVTFTFEHSFKMPTPSNICHYLLPFGTLSGYVTDTNGKRYNLDGMLGIGEDKTTNI